MRGAVENWSRSEQGARKLAPCCGAHNRIETTRGQGIQWGSHRLYLSLFMGWFFEPGSWGEQWSLPLLARLAGAAGARQGAALRLNGGAGNVAPHGWGALLAARLLVQAAPKVSRAVLGAVAIQGGPGSSKARRKLQAHRRQGGVGQRSVVSGWRLQGKLAPGMHPLFPPACLPARGAHLAAAESLGHIQLDGKGDGVAERGHQPQPLVGMGTGLEQPHHHLHSKKEGGERAQQQCWAGAIIDFWRCSRCRCRRRSCRLLAGTDCMDVVGRKLTVGKC